MAGRVGDHQSERARETFASPVRFHQTTRLARRGAPTGEMMNQLLPRRHQPGLPEMGVVRRPPFVGIPGLKPQDIQTTAFIYDHFTPFVFTPARGSRLLASRCQGLRGKPPPSRDLSLGGHCLSTTNGGLARRGYILSCASSPRGFLQSAATA